MWQEVRVETSRTVLEVLRLRLAPGIQLLAITMRISGNIIVVNRDALARSDYLLYGSSGASGIETNLLATDHEIIRESKYTHEYCCCSVRSWW